MTWTLSRLEFQLSHQKCGEPFAAWRLSVNLSTRTTPDMLVLLYVLAAAAAVFFDVTFNVL